MATDEFNRTPAARERRAVDNTLELRIENRRLRAALRAVERLTWWQIFMGRLTEIVDKALER